MEIFWTGSYSLLQGDFTMEGRSTLWMLPIYGSAVFLEPIHYRIAHWPWFARGLFWLFAIWGIEYAAGWTIRTLTGISPWYYDGAFAIDHLIRLDYAPVWFIVGFIFEKVHLTLEELRI